MRLYERQREHLGFPRGEAHKLKQRLQALWKVCPLCDTVHDVVMLRLRVSSLRRMH